MLIQGPGRRSEGRSGHPAGNLPLAADLPPDQAQKFLDGLTSETVKGLLNAEELTLLKERVRHSRFKEQLAGDRKMRLTCGLAAAREKLLKQRREYDLAMLRTKRAAQKLSTARETVKRLEIELERSF